MFKRKFYPILSLACMAAALAVPKVDASVGVGDLIRFQNGPGSPGGEFGVALAATPSLTEFLTFCTEKNEYLDFSSDFRVTSISHAAENGGQGGPSPDPIDGKTAWLYYNFRNGTLPSYSFGDLSDTSTTRVLSANRLQNAVWRLEDEGHNSTISNFYYDLAVAEEIAFNGGGYSGNFQAAIDNVRVMNIVWASTGALAQSQLFLVPEPGTIAIWSVLGVIGFVGYWRR